MKLIKMTLVALTSLVVICGVSAQLGQSAGNLDFGKIYLNESKNLSYLLINSQNKSLKFDIEHPKGINVRPQNGTIDAESQQRIIVTVEPEEKGNFSGSLKAKVILPRKEKGMVNLKVEMKKEYSYEAIPKPSEGNETGLKGKASLDGSLMVVGVILLIFGLLLYNNIKGGKRK